MLSTGYQTCNVKCWYLNRLSMLRQGTDGTKATLLAVHVGSDSISYTAGLRCRLL